MQKTRKNIRIDGSNQTRGSADASGSYNNNLELRFKQRVCIGGENQFFPWLAAQPHEIYTRLPTPVTETMRPDQAGAWSTNQGM